MTRVTRVTFGPGSLESVELRYRNRPRSLVREARIVGTYRIYCGNGNEHAVNVASQYEPVYVLNRMLPIQPDTDAHDEDIARELVAWATEDWSDPCEDAFDD